MKRIVSLVIILILSISLFDYISVSAQAKTNNNNKILSYYKTLDQLDKHIFKLKIQKKALSKGSSLIAVNKKIMKGNRYRTNFFRLLTNYKKTIARNKSTKNKLKKLTKLNAAIKKYLKITPNYVKTLGIFVDKNPYSRLPEIEELTQHKFESFLWYQSIIENFNEPLASWLYSRGTSLQLSWEPRNPSMDPVNQPQYSLKSIANGNHDEEIKKWAQQMKNFEQTIYFRPMCEMNGDWTSWSGSANGNSPSDYISAWRHVFNIFQQVGAKNVLFIWSPNRDGSYNDALNTFNTYYPGNDYVHYIGINGYNWGRMYSTPNWTSEWQNFDQIFQDSYNAFTQLSNKPIIISETNTTEVGGDKALWYKETLTKLTTDYPKISMIYFFSINKETDWRIQSSPSSLESFRKYSKYHK